VLEGLETEAGEIKEGLWADPQPVPPGSGGSGAGRTSGESICYTNILRPLVLSKSLLRKHQTHPCQNPHLECLGELVDFSRKLTYPRAGPKTKYFVSQSSLRRFDHMFRYLLVLPILIGYPASGFAQFIDKGDNVEVMKGTTLCSNVKMQQAEGAFDPGKVFWRVTSNMRTNGTQTVAAIEYETIYNRQSGETTSKERQYDTDFAVFFKRAPEHRGMLLMVSPQDGRVEAIVEVCKKKKQFDHVSQSVKRS
jgi:hypothetical protein